MRVMDGSKRPSPGWFGEEPEQSPVKVRKRRRQRQPPDPSRLRRAFCHLAWFLLICTLTAAVIVNAAYWSPMGHLELRFIGWAH